MWIKAPWNSDSLEERKDGLVSSLFPPKSELALDIGVCIKILRAEEARNETKEACLGPKVSWLDLKSGGCLSMQIRVRCYRRSKRQSSPSETTS